jgi:hypothetical protein
MELAGSDLKIGPVSKQRSRKSVSVPPSPRTEIDAMFRRNRCNGATGEQYFAGSAGGPQGRGPVNSSKANLA